MRYKIFGCKTNKYYTEKWLGSEELSGKEGIFIASCVVTDKAKSKWLRYIRQEIKTLAENEKIYLSGCGTIKDGKVDENFYTQYPELAQYREKIELLPEDPKNTLSTSHAEFISASPKSWGGPETSSGWRTNLQSLKSSFAKIFTRKYLVVQMGCDNFCTFCLTVQARGRHRSRSTEEILAEIREFTENGGKEIVITGINIGAWGASNSNKISESRFSELIKTILDETTIERIRISSLGVEFVTDELIELFKETRIIAHVHLSIQSGSDKILKAMNRHYDRAHLLSVMQKLSNIKRKDGVKMGIWADLIVGFPGETDDDFTDTLSLLDFALVKVHAFPFSAHTSGYSVAAGSYADQVPEAIKKARLDTLIAQWDERRKRFLAENNGYRMRLLTERVGDGTFLGWSENYIELDEKNFSPLTDAIIRRGQVIEGTYHYHADSSLKYALDF